MADTNFNIGLQLTGLGNTVGGLQQTTQAINQVTAAQQRATQASQLGSSVAGGIRGGLGIPTSVGAAVAGVMGFTRALFQTAGQVKDMSEQLNISTTEFQMLAKAAADTGVPMSRLVGSLGLLDQQRQAAIGGNERLTAAFAALGIGVGELNSDTVRAIDLQRRLADATANGTEAQRAAARVLLGAQGARLLPALQAMAGMNAGDFASADAIAEVDAVGKAWENIWGKIKMTGIEVIADLSDKAKSIFEDVMVDRSGSGATRESRVRRAAAIDQAAIDAGVITAEQAGPEFQQLQRFNRASDEARQRGQRLRFSDFAALEDTQQQRANAERAALDQVLTANAAKRLKMEQDSMTPAQKRADLERRIAEERAIAAGDPDAVRAAQAEGRALDLEAQRAGIKDVPASGPNAPLPTNAWERMGANFGPGPDRAEEAIAIARDTQRGVERMAVSLDSFAALARLGVPVQFKDQP